MREASTAVMRSYQSDSGEVLKTGMS